MIRRERRHVVLSVNVATDDLRVNSGAEPDWQPSLVRRRDVDIYLRAAALRKDLSTSSAMGCSRGRILEAAAACWTIVVSSKNSSSFASAIYERTLYHVVSRVARPTCWK